MLQDLIDTFFKRHALGKGPYLLGYSGGPDSKALLHALLFIREKIPFSLHLVHVDHGWREESAGELVLLQKEAEALGLPFHGVRLNPPGTKGNLEAVARESRYAFFRSVYEKIQAKGVFLGHHKDDLAETVLKRVLEGAHLRSLGGMEEYSEREGMCLLRPFLSVYKKELLNSLPPQTFYIEDKTNGDLRFLRGRMRKEVFPFLKQAFGKESLGNLCRLSARSFELKRYFSEKLKIYQERKTSYVWGDHLDLSGIELEKIEWEYLLREFWEKGGYPLSTSLFEHILLSIREGRAAKMFTMEGIAFHVDRSHLFILKKPLPLYIGAVPLKEGIVRHGEWTIEVKRVSFSGASLGWRGALEGKLCGYFPMGEYSLELPPKECPAQRKRWNQKKVPSFLRESFPVICQNGAVMYEFLTDNCNSGSNDLISVEVSF